MISLQPDDFIGVTGIINSGKSFFSHNIQNYENKHYTNSHHCPFLIFDIDVIRRELLWNSLSTLAIHLRKKIIHFFKIPHYDHQYFFNREEFTELLFSQLDTLNSFNLLAKPFFIEFIIQNQKDNHINIIEWVHLIEDQYYLDLPIKHIFYTSINQDKWLKNTTDLILSRAKYIHNEDTQLSLLEQSHLSFSIIKHEQS